jgi:uncharacterized SAM-binding protein YcdF (DUF218 family)
VFAVAALTAALWMTPLADWTVSALERRFPRPAPAARVDGIIVLGGWADTTQLQRRGVPEVNEKVDRLFEGLALAHRHPGARILFPGGNGDMFHQDDAEARTVELMLQSIGFPMERVLIERKSRSTAENAVYGKELVQPRPGEVWVLVTTAMHMPRAVWTFRKVGWDVVPHPCDFRSDGGDWFWPFNFMGSIKKFEYSTHEWLGIAAYWVAGKI